MRRTKAQPPSRPEGLLMDGDAAAAALGVSRRTLEKWRASGRGPAYVRIGPKLAMYRREDLEAFITRSRVAPEAA